ncbi:MAG: hypothetical protein WCX46_03020 [Candidatus Paceibacterota bacterium]
MSEYTRTAAFNLLKEFLGIPKNALINRTFFNLFFLENDRTYILKKEEDEIRKIIQENNLKEVNAEYYKNKKENNEESNRELFVTVIANIQKVMKGKKVLIGASQNDYAVEF